MLEQDKPHSLIQPRLQRSDTCKNGNSLLKKKKGFIVHRGGGSPGDYARAGLQAPDCNDLGLAEELRTSMCWSVGHSGRPHLPHGRAENAESWGQNSDAV